MSKEQEMIDKQIALLEGLKEYLYTNRGNCTTSNSDKRILDVFKQLQILSYNEAFYHLKKI